MVEPQGWSPVKSIEVSQFVDAINTLSHDYMTYFNVGHITPHIIRCLIESVCSEAPIEAKNVATNKISELHTGAMPKHASDIMRTLLSFSRLSVKNALIRCTEENKRLRIEIIRRQPKVLSMEDKISNKMKYMEGDAYRTSVELKESRKMLDAYEKRIQAMEDELHRVRPDYNFSEKLFSSRTGQITEGNLIMAEMNKDDDNNEKKRKSNTMIQVETKQKTPKSRSSILQIGGSNYSPSTDFVMQAARKLASESRLSTLEEEKNELKKDLVVITPTSTKIFKPDINTNNVNKPIMEFSLSPPPPSYFLPFHYQTTKENYDVIPPSMQFISSEAVNTLISDKRPLRVQEEERAKRLKEWSPLGKQIFSCKHLTTGPTSYTRQVGVHHVIHMEKEMTRLFWDK